MALSLHAELFSARSAPHPSRCSVGSETISLPKFAPSLLASFRQGGRLCWMDPSSLLGTKLGAEVSISSSAASDRLPRGCCKLEDPLCSESCRGFVADVKVPSLVRLTLAPPWLALCSGKVDPVTTSANCSLFLDLGVTVLWMLLPRSLLPFGSCRLGSECEHELVNAGFSPDAARRGSASTLLLLSRLLSTPDSAEATVKVALGRVLLFMTNLALGCPLGSRTNVALFRLRPAFTTNVALLRCGSKTEALLSQVDGLARAASCIWSFLALTASVASACFVG